MTAIGSLPLGPKAERSASSGSNTIARQSAMVGDSSNDEEWSDDLPRDVRQPAADWESKKRTNLSLCEDGQEDIRSVTSGTPRSDEQQGINSVEGRRLDEHGDDGSVQAGGPGWSTHGGTNVPAVHGEADDDENCEKGVEPNRDRKVWKTEIDGDRVPDAAVRLGGLVDEGDAHRCDDGVGFKVRLGGRNQMRTDGGKEYEAWEGDDPNVHSVNNVTTIELEASARLSTWSGKVAEKRTKRPSAIQLFKRNMRLGTTVIGLE